MMIRNSDLYPLRKVVREDRLDGWTPKDKILFLECGHMVLRTPSQKTPKRVRCRECGFPEFTGDCQTGPLRNRRSAGPARPQHQ
jgi:hypothetical protein